MSYTGRPPRLRELCTLRLNDWTKVGVCLGFELRDLVDIKVKVCGDKKEGQKKMFARWLLEKKPQDYTELLQALVNVDETMAVSQLQSKGVLQVVEPLSSPPITPIGYNYVSNLNFMLSGPDISSKKEVEKIIDQYVEDHSSQESRDWIYRIGLIRSLLIANRWFEARLLNFIQINVPNFIMSVKVNLGELAATNELAPLFLPARFFCLSCISEYDCFRSSYIENEDIFHQTLHAISNGMNATTRASPNSFAAAAVCYFNSPNSLPEEQVRTVDGTLKYFLNKCGCCTRDNRVVKYCSRENNQMIYPLTNTSSSSYKDQLYNTIGSVSRHQSLHKVVPAPVHKFLYMCWGRGGLMRLADAQELAFYCGVSKEEVRFILQQIHEEHSFILYYNDIPMLKDLVICDTQLLINAFNAFVVAMQSIILKNACAQVDQIKSFANQQNDSSLNALHIKELLSFYNMISEKQINDSLTVCFMPFLLPKIHIVPQTNPSFFPSPFIIKFSTGTVPSGVFYALVCQLFKIWQVNDEQQYKNRISFHIEGAISCTLSLHSHFIEVAVTGATLATPQTLFQYIRNEVIENIKISMAFFSHAENSKVRIRYFCPFGLNQDSPHLATVSMEEDKKILICEDAYCLRKSEITVYNAVWTQNFQNIRFLSGLETEDESDDTVQLVKEHIQHEGCIQLRVAKCLLFGPPNVGKTSTRMRLTGDIVNVQERGPQMPSTGINNPITVNVHHQTESSSVFIATNDSDHWRPQNLQDQADTFINYILSSNADSSPITSSIGLEPANLQSPQHQKSIIVGDMESQPSNFVTTEDTSSPSRPSKVTLDRDNGQVAMETNIEKTEAIPLQDTIIPQWILQEGESLSFIQGLIKAGRWKEVQMRLKNIKDTTLLQIIDTGGQPEFHEILPFLLPGPALYLLFVNLTQKFNESFPIVYTQEGGVQSDIKYQSNFTYKEMLLQLLNTISCINSIISHHGRTRSIATLLGTHADATNESNIKYLQEEISTCEELRVFIEKNLLQLNESFMSIFPLDNLNGQLEEIQKLRHFLSKIIFRHFKPQDIPTSWFLFYLALRQKYEATSGFCHINDATRLAAAFNITIKDFQKFLEFFHNRFGTILHYPEISSFKHLIICNPNIIFKPISDLIASSFGDSIIDPHLLHRIRQSGQVPLELLHSFTPHDSYITAAMIVDLLKHHNIVTEAHGPDNTPIYFMPFLLKPDNLSLITAADIKELDPAPLVIKFKDAGYVPVGFFPSLIVELSKSWKLTDRLQQYRNHIIFIADDSTFAEVHLLMFADRLEVRVDCNTGKDTHKLCMEALRAVNEAIEEIKKVTPYFKRIAPEFGFYCPTGLNKDNSLHFALCLNLTEPERILCLKTEPCHGKKFPLLPKHKIWFPGHEYIDPEEEMEVDRTPPAPLPINYKNEVEVLLNTNQVSTQTLDVTEINELFFELPNAVCLDWFSLGMLLKVEYGKLKIIETQENSKLDRCLAAMLDLWLRRNDASYHQLVEALLHEKMGGKFYEAAYRIAAKHPKV